MLDPWALANSGIKKRIAGILYERAHLREARCLHALSEAEARAFRDYGLRTPICVIPNGLSVPNAELVEPDANPAWIGTLPDGAQILLYLGRIHPKKGLRLLLEALRESILAQLVDNSWFLVIAGWDQNGHLSELQSLTDHLGLRQRVRFVGPLFDKEKKIAFQKANAFILPSLSEGLPMAVLEAWSYRLPVMMTRCCNLPIGFERSAALSMDPSVQSISGAIGDLSAMSDSDRLKMGRCGRDIVVEMFSWEKVTLQMRSMYEWALGGGPLPSSLSTY